MEGSYDKFPLNFRGNIPRYIPGNTPTPANLTFILSNSFFHYLISSTSFFKLTSRRAYRSPSINEVVIGAFLADFTFRNTP